MSIKVFCVDGRDFRLQSTNGAEDRAGIYIERRNRGVGPRRGAWRQTHFLRAHRRSIQTLAFSAYRHIKQQPPPPTCVENPLAAALFNHINRELSRQARRRAVRRQTDTQLAPCRLRAESGSWIVRVSRTGRSITGNPLPTGPGRCVALADGMPHSDAWYASYMMERLEIPGDIPEVHALRSHLREFMGYVRRRFHPHPVQAHARCGPDRSEADATAMRDAANGAVVVRHLSSRAAGPTRQEFCVNGVRHRLHTVTDPTSEYVGSLDLVTWEVSRRHGGRWTHNYRFYQSDQREKAIHDVAERMIGSDPADIPTLEFERVQTRVREAVDRIWPRAGVIANVHAGWAVRGELRLRLDDRAWRFRAYLGRVRLSVLHEPQSRLPARPTSGTPRWRDVSWHDAHPSEREAPELARELAECVIPCEYAEIPEDEFARVMVPILQWLTRDARCDTPEYSAWGLITNRNALGVDFTDGPKWRIRKASADRFAIYRLETRCQRRVVYEVDYRSSSRRYPTARRIVRHMLGLPRAWGDTRLLDRHIGRLVDRIDRFIRECRSR